MPYHMGMSTTIEQPVTVHRLARLLRLPADWLQREANAGRLPHINAGGRLLFNVRRVTEVLAARAAKEGGPHE
jgi:hypothetical protein